MRRLDAGLLSRGDATIEHDSEACHGMPRRASVIVMSNRKNNKQGSASSECCETPARRGLPDSLALMALLTGLALAYFSHSATDRQLAQASFHDASADLLARSALEIVVGSLKREIVVAGTTVTQANIQPQRSGDDASIPNLIRRSVRNDGIPPPAVPSFARCELGAR